MLWQGRLEEAGLGEVGEAAKNKYDHDFLYV